MNRTNKKIKVLSVMLAIVLMFFATLVYILVDFYNDYQCSTTTDTKWFLEHNCERYIKNN